MTKIISIAVFCILAGCSLHFAQAEPSPFASAKPFQAGSEIDRLTLADWKKHRLAPAEVCSDAVFVRRVFLDVIGTLPTAAEAGDFLANNDSSKRSGLIDQLLERDEFADYWAMKWDDLLRVKAEFPINLWPNAAQAYHQWIRAALRENKPCDQFARELLTSSGSNFRAPPVNFYRALQSREPSSLAQTVALTFMGVRSEKWPPQRRDGLAHFFSHIGYKSTAEWKEEIVFFDASQFATNGTTIAVLPDGKKVKLAGDRDPREVFADWLLNKKNPWFARNLANRAWYWLLGRGIMHEPDDFRPDNPPVNPALLAYLEQELVASSYNLKHLYRLILNSQTYQLSSIPRSQDPQAEAHFAHYALRRLDAEVLVDALNQVTGTSERYFSAIPEPFTFIPEDQRAIALPDGSISSSFLELFGRPPRDTGLASERNNLSTAAQRLHLLNSSHIQRKLTQGKLGGGVPQAGKTPRDIVRHLYLTILSRPATEQEWQIALDYVRTGKVKPRDAFIDLAWALMNSPEFLYRH